MKKNELPPPLEHQEQVAVIDWCNAHHVKWPCLEFIYACPNAAKRTWGGAEYMRAEGLKAGVPDLCLPFPVVNDATSGCIFWHGLYIEMKRKPNKPSPEQKKWLAYLEKAGYKAMVAYSADEAIEIIKDYLEK